MTGREEESKLYKVRFKELKIFSLEKRKYSSKYEVSERLFLEMEVKCKLLGHQEDRNYGEMGFPQHTEEHLRWSEGRVGSLGGANGFPIGGGFGWLFGSYYIDCGFM